MNLSDFCQTVPGQIAVMVTVFLCFSPRRHPGLACCRQVGWSLIFTRWKHTELSTLCKSSFLTFCLTHVLQAGSPADVLCPGLPASGATDLFPTALNVSCQIFRKLRIPWLPFPTGQSILTTRHLPLLFQLRSSPFLLIFCLDKQIFCFKSHRLAA